MDYDSLSHRIFCPVRKGYVKSSPEEIVRQALLRCMIQELGYPAALLVVEKKISELPHSVQELKNGSKRVPNRRLDILCYEPNFTRPLLLIECKAHSFSHKQQQQLLGYNYYVNASFLVLIGSKRMQFFTVGNTVEQREVTMLPSYADLMADLVQLKKTL